MLYLILGSLLAGVIIFIKIYIVLKNIIATIKSQQTFIINLSISISKIKTDIENLKTHSDKEQAQIIDKFNLRLEELKSYSDNKDNLIKIGLNKTIKQINNGIYLEEFDF
jgi:hypothetical protein